MIDTVLGMAQHELCLSERNQIDNVSCVWAKGLVAGSGSTLPTGASFIRSLAAHRGSSVALEAGDASVDYTELLSFSAEITAALADQGLGRPAAPVLVIAPRSRPSTVLLLLALWRADLVPLLIDEQVPAARAAEAMRILRPAAVLRRAPAPAPATLAVLDDGWNVEVTGPELAGPELVRVVRDPISECPAPAYVAMTSGSTGAPRLVLCCWTGLDLVARQWAQRAFVGDSARLFQFASPSYDAFYTEVLPTFLAGGTIVFSPERVWDSPTRLVRFMAQEHVTHFTAPPSYLARLVAVPAPWHLKTLSAAGEKLEVGLAREARGHADRVLNAYGPTETTVCAMTHEVTGDEEEIPLGRALDGVTVDVVDGMIEIRGPTVAAGYLGETGDAADSSGYFALSRAGTAAGRRYVTGDLAEMRNGQTYFLGRRDRQVKIHGHRADPSSIELRLRGIGGVENCAVFPVNDQIACLLVADRPLRDVSADSRALLPSAEWPSRWAKVSRIRYLTSDKLDVPWAMEALARHAEPDIQHSPDAATAAQKALPAWLASAWLRHASLLSADTDFFSAGGDSLSAMQLLDDIYNETNVDIDLADFLTSPTPEWLARHFRPIP